MPELPRISAFIKDKKTFWIPYCIYNLSNMYHTLEAREKEIIMQNSAFKSGFEKNI